MKDFLTKGDIMGSLSKLGLTAMLISVASLNSFAAKVTYQIEGDNEQIIVNLEGSKKGSSYPFPIFESEIFCNELEEKLVKDNAKKTIVAIDLSFDSSVMSSDVFGLLRGFQEKNIDVSNLQYLNLSNTSVQSDVLTICEDLLNSMHFTQLDLRGVESKEQTEVKELIKIHKDKKWDLKVKLD